MSTVALLTALATLAPGWSGDPPPAPSSGAIQAPRCDPQAPGALAPSWSPDGSRLVFSSNRDGNWEIYTIAADGGLATRLTRLDGTHDYFPYFSPDGRRIAFMSIDTSGATATVTVMRADGSALARLTDIRGYSGDPHWSPDGTRIAFHSRRDGDEDVYLMDADGGHVRQLTNDQANDFNPIWSPDGSRIAFVSNRSGNADVYLMNSDGTGVRNLTNDSLHNYFPFWSPDGATLLFAARPEFRVSAGMEVYAIDREGGGRRQLTHNDAYDSAPHWSPDGARIAFASCRTGSYEIHVMRADGGDVRRVTYTGDQVAIERVLDDYVRGWREGDTTVLGRVFAPNGMVMWPGGGGTPGLATLTFAENLRRRRPNDAYGVPWRMVALDVVDGRAAVAKLWIADATVDYVDLLTLYRLDGAWRIVNKAFVTRPR